MRAVRKVGGSSGAPGRCRGGGAGVADERAGEVVKIGAKVVALGRYSMLTCGGNPTSPSSGPGCVRWCRPRTEAALARRVGGVSAESVGGVEEPASKIPCQSAP